MRFLADEGCDYPVVKALREAGHDVTAVFETTRGTADEVAIALALAEGRTLITKDKDFGQLVFAQAREATGVILLRFPGNQKYLMPGAVPQAVEQLGEHLDGQFVVS